MAVAEVARILQFILAPVVLVTACAIVVSGFLAHYAAINDRLRLMAHERLELLYTPHQDGLAATLRRERLTEIAPQIPELIRRHRLVRDAILLVYIAIFLFVADMFVIAAAAASNSPAAGAAILAVFLAGTAALLGGLLLTVIEVRTSQRAVEREARRVASLHE